MSDDVCDAIAVSGGDTGDGAVPLSGDADARSSSARPGRVLMYSKWGCGYCMWARRLLEAKGVEVEHVNVTFRPSAFREMVQRSGGRTSAPQIFIGDIHVGGYRELVDLDDRGKLDELLARADAPTLSGEEETEDTR